MPFSKEKSSKALVSYCQLQFHDSLCVPNIIVDLLTKDVSFYRNCGAASVEESNRVMWYYQLS